jgi:hypothetical protein
VIVRWPSGLVQRRTQVSLDQRITIVEGDEVGVPSPWPVTHALELSPPYPNPTHQRTLLHFCLPEAGPVRVSILDVQGRLVAKLADGMQPAGWHSLSWEVDRDVAAGIYVTRLEASGQTRTRKLIVVP